MILINEEKVDYKKVTDKDMPMAKKWFNAPKPYAGKGDTELNSAYYQWRLWNAVKWYRYRSHPRAAGTHDGGSPTDASPSQPDTRRCIQVGRDTYALTSQPGTSYAPHDYDSILVIDSGSPNDPHMDTPRKYKKPRSGSQTKRKPTEGPYKRR